MRVLLSIFSINERILHIKKNLQALGCEVELVYSDSYRQICPYYMKKIDEFGFHFGKQRYFKLVQNKIYTLLNEFHPDIVLFVNPPDNILLPEDIKYINTFSKTVCWFVDSVSDHPEILDFVKLFSKVYVFEQNDIAYLNHMHIKGTYLPVGYNDAFFDIERAPKSIDILFIGSPFHNRLILLEKLASIANKKNWKLKIIGPFYDSSYPWKKLIFKKKFPCINRYLENRRISSEESAKLYARTKICLNIHDNRHTSPNPRTYEILATGSFEIIDHRKYWDVLTPGKDIIEYNNIKDLITKIDLYLTDNDLREKIASNGQKCIIKNRSLKMSLQKILSDL